MALKEYALRLWPKVQSALIMLFVAGSGIMLAKSTWLVVAPEPEVVAPKIKAASSSGSQSDQKNWSQISQSIARRAFFGEVEVAKEDASAQVDVPETKLKFSLVALLAGTDGEGFAIIGQSKSAGKVFQVGDDLYGQAELAAVYADRIIIKRNGRLETLRYEKVKSSDILKPVAAKADTADDADSFQEVMSRASKSVSEGGDMASEVQSVMSYVDQRVNEDPEAFMKEMGLETTDQGYQVSRKARQLQMIGLRPGDIVTAVNDTPVGNVSSDQALLNQVMQTGGELKIQITRGSRSFTIYQTIPTN